MMGGVETLLYQLINLQIDPYACSIETFLNYKYFKIAGNASKSRKQFYYRSSKRPQQQCPCSVIFVNFLTNEGGGGEHWLSLIPSSFFRGFLHSN